MISQSDFGLVDLSTDRHRCCLSPDIMLTKERKHFNKPVCFSRTDAAMFDVVSYGVTDDVAPARRQLTRQRRVESEKVSLWCCLTENTRKNADHQSKVPFSSRPIMKFLTAVFQSYVVLTKQPLQALI